MGFVPFTTIVIPSRHFAQYSEVCVLNKYNTGIHILILYLVQDIHNSTAVLITLDMSFVFSLSRSVLYLGGMLRSRIGLKLKDSFDGLTLAIIL